MTAGGETEKRPAPGTEPGEQSELIPWYPPLPLWKLFLLLVLTFGFYSVFYMYRTARELRDHGNPGLTPWLYPFAYLIPIAAGFAAGKLAAAAKRSAYSDERFGGASPVFVGTAVLVCHMALSAASLATLTSVFLAALVLFALPWLLLQHQLNRIKRARLGNGSDAIRFTTRPERFTRLQWAGLVVGGLLLSALSFTLWDDYQRFAGDELQASQPYVDPLGRFVLQAPRDGWVIVGPDYLAEDSELELLGPGQNDWAIVFVHEQTGWSIDDLVEFRFDQLREFTDEYSETRRLFEGTEIAVSHAAYSGLLALEGRSDYAVTSFVTPERAVEMIVFTAGPDRARARGTELAESLRLAPVREEAL